MDREIEKFIIRQPPIEEKDDYDSENSWISDGLPSSSISKLSRDVAGKFEIHRNQGVITEKRNEQKKPIVSKLEISREIHLEFSKRESTGSCHGSKPLARSKISEISHRQKCFSGLKISNPRISCTLSGVRRSS